MQELNTNPFSQDNIASQKLQHTIEQSVKLEVNNFISKVDSKDSIKNEALVGIEKIGKEKLISELDNGCKKPSKKLSEMALKISKSPDLFVNSHLREEKELMTLIDKTPFGTSLQSIDESKKDGSQLKAYKDFFVSLFESVSIIKRIEPLNEAELEIRILSIPRPINLQCTFDYPTIANKTLVLDLDETLIHCQEEGHGEVQIPIKLPDSTIIEVIN